MGRVCRGHKATPGTQTMIDIGTQQKLNCIGCLETRSKFARAEIRVLPKQNGQTDRGIYIKLIYFDRTANTQNAPVLPWRPRWRVTYKGEENGSKKAGCSVHTAREALRGDPRRVAIEQPAKSAYVGKDGGELQRATENRPT